MTIMRSVVSLILLFCLGLSVWWGISFAKRWPGGPTDFQAVYFGTRCLLQHHDPYRVADLADVYRVDGGERPSDTPKHRETITLYVNLPATFLIVVPFALLPLNVAQFLWGLLIAGGFLLGSFLMWTRASEFAPILTGSILAFLFANSQLLFFTGNTIGIVVSLCAIAVWCFIENRFVSAGILCIGIALAIKPHDAGLVWLYFVLAGGDLRKHAIKALGVTFVLALVAAVWVSVIAPHWIQEWSANMKLISVPGGLNSPGPMSLSLNLLGCVISLQTVFALFRDDPRFYDLLTYLICGTMMAIWAVRTLRAKFSPERAWIALAFIVPLSMIVTYHRSYDAKLLLLTFPAFAMLWAGGGLLRWVATAVNAAVMLLTADLPLAILMNWAKDQHIPSEGIFKQLLTVVMVRPVPIVLLVMSIFYLCVYMRFCNNETELELRILRPSIRQRDNSLEAGA